MDTSMRIVDTEPDSMYYGICLETIGRDSILFLSDNGDSTWLTMSATARRIGTVEADSRLAIIKTTKTGNEVSLFVNLSMLMGQWVQPDPVSAGNLTGFMLAEGGAAQGLNIAEFNYDNWRIFNGKLLLDITYEEGFGTSETDTFNIMRLTSDSLWLLGSQRMFLHRMNRDEKLDITQDYSVSPELGSSLDPNEDGLDEDNKGTGDLQFFNPDFDVVP